MFNPVDQPFLVLVVSLPTFWFAAWIGASLRARRRAMKEESREDFSFVLGATLTLLGLIIGFSFSMAVSRYEQRKNYEEDEANAIGTEYLRADLLPASDAAKVRELLKSYLEQRIVYYKTRNERQRQMISAQNAQVQTKLWAAVTAPALAQQTSVAALAVSGMNDVLNSQGYTQAAWWNRIPSGAWVLLFSISVFCNLLIGYAMHVTDRFLFLILPIALSVSLFLIADIDSPRHGIISVRPQNLESLAQSLHSP
jgi:hypothetical protein